MTIIAIEISAAVASVEDDEDGKPSIKICLSTAGVNIVTGYGSTTILDADWPDVRDEIDRLFDLRARMSGDTKKAPK